MEGSSCHQYFTSDPTAYHDNRQSIDAIILLLHYRLPNRARTPHTSQSVDLKSHIFHRDNHLSFEHFHRFDSAFLSTVRRYLSCFIDA